MSRITGKFGVVRVGATPTVVGELRSWEYTETAALIQAGIMGSANGDHETGQKYTTGTLTCWWSRVTGATDPAPDAGQLEIVVGSDLAIELHPNGTGSGKPQLAGTAVINEIAATSETDGIIEATYSFGLRGEWTESVQT